uniref:Sperm-lysin n=1 Tax=Acrobeloides nanus TaxID=290746 RepID=A0A914DMH2_9BILA
MLTFGSLGLSLGINLANAITVLTNVAYDNLNPFYTGQVLPQIAAFKARGMTFNGICNNDYRFINSFYTLKRSKTIMNRIKAGFSTSDWTAIRTKLASYIQFAANGV